MRSIADETYRAASGTNCSLSGSVECLCRSWAGPASAVDVDERDYVRAIRAEPDAKRKLKIYAAALHAIQPRLAPIFKVLRTAARQDAELDALWQEISQRRAANMRLLAQDLAATGCLRRDLSISKVADIVWSLNSPEFYLLLIGREVGRQRTLNIGRRTPGYGCCWKPDW